MDLPAPGTVLASPSDSLPPLVTGPPRPTSGATPPQAAATAPAGTATITSIVGDRFSKIPLKTTTFTGVLRATEFPTQSGEFGTWKVRATATSKPTIRRRSAA